MDSVMDGSPLMSMNGTSSLGHAELGQRLESFGRSDQERNKLLHELVGNYQRLELRASELYADLQNEQRSRREWQQRAAELERKIQTISRASDAGPKVAVLIDGDGAPFLDELYALGEAGGSDAAYRLYDELRKHIANLYPDESTSHWSIIVQIFVNADGLNSKLHACNLLAANVHLDKIGRAFSSAQSLFQFVAVKAGKEQADYKIRHWFQVYMNDIQCKHIILGGICHDNGYLPMLEPHKHNLDAQSRISLLPTVPAQPAFKQMHFKPIRIPTVFRSDHLPSRPSMSTSNGSAVPTGPASTYTLPNRTVSADPPLDMMNGYGPTSPSPAPAVTPAPTLNHSDSWARVSKSLDGSVKEFTIATSKKAAPKKFIIYNKDNHRLDQPIPYADKASQDKLFARIKEVGKVCNTYHLTGKCPGGCGFVHGERMAPGELGALKYRARTRACASRGYCADYDCTMGHVCPYTVNCQGKGCAFEDAHGIDLMPAVKWYEDDTIEKIGEA